MKAQALLNFPMPWLTCIALVLFFSVFVGMLLWVLKPGNKAMYAELEKLPID